MRRDRETHDVELKHGDLPVEEMTLPINKRSKVSKQGSLERQRIWYIERLTPDGLWLKNTYYSSFGFDIPRARELVSEIPGLRLVIRQPDGSYRPDGAAPRRALLGSKNPFVAYCPECGRDLPNNAERIIQHLKSSHAKGITMEEARRIAMAPI